jgi:hypothetical protein
MAIRLGIQVPVVNVRGRTLALWIAPVNESALWRRVLSAIQAQQTNAIPSRRAPDSSERRSKVASSHALFARSQGLAIRKLIGQLIALWARMLVERGSRAKAFGAYGVEEAGLSHFRCKEKRLWDGRRIALKDSSTPYRTYAPRATRS